MPHTITVLHVPSCAGGAAAFAAASRLGAARDDVEVAEVLIEDEETALERGLRGSPTVLIDGRDLEQDTAIPPGSMG